MLNFKDRIANWLRFNLSYIGSPPWDTGVSPPELLEFIRKNEPGNAIDLGCGTGTNLVTLGRAGWRVTGVDFAIKAVSLARKRLDRESIRGEVRRGDVSQPDVVHGSYDLVLDIGCYHGLPVASRVAYRSNVYEILRPGGHFLWYAHWSDKDRPAEIGISQADVVAFQELLFLDHRQDSNDRWGRKASWMRYFKNE